MLNQHQPDLRALRRAGQRGMVLLVALVVLVVIMVAGIAMMRSVDTATLVAGNLAFQQSATNSADQAIEQAIAILKGMSPAELGADQPTNGYYATLHTDQSPKTAQDGQPAQSWQDFWAQNFTGAGSHYAGHDNFGNDMWFVVHRECQLPQPVNAQCVASPAITKASGNSQEAGEIELQSGSQIYYRITVRVAGPKRTESYVQAHIAM